MSSSTPSQMPPRDESISPRNTLRLRPTPGSAQEGMNRQQDVVYPVIPGIQSSARPISMEEHFDRVGELLESTRRVQENLVESLIAVQRKQSEVGTLVDSLRIDIREKVLDPLVSLSTTVHQRIYQLGVKVDAVREEQNKQNNQNQFHRVLFAVEMLEKDRRADKNTCLEKLSEAESHILEELKKVEGSLLENPISEKLDTMERALLAKLTEIEKSWLLKFASHREVLASQIDFLMQKQDEITAERVPRERIVHGTENGTERDLLTLVQDLTRKIDGLVAQASTDAAGSDEDDEDHAEENSFGAAGYLAAIICPFILWGLMLNLFPSLANEYGI